MTSSLYDTVDARYGCITTFANDVGAVSRSLRIYGEWAENEISFLRRLIPSGGTAVDVGAYVGTHTLAFSRFVGSAGSVVSFEPQPDTFKLLEANVADNHVSNVRLENAAVSDASGDLRIPLINILHEGSFGSASLRRGACPRASARAAVTGIGGDRACKDDRLARPSPVRSD